MRRIVLAFLAGGVITGAAFGAISVIDDGLEVVRLRVSPSAAPVDALVDLAHLPEKWDEIRLEGVAGAAEPVVLLSDVRRDWAPLTIPSGANDENGEGQPIPKGNYRIVAYHHGERVGTAPFRIIAAARGSTWRVQTVSRVEWCYVPLGHVLYRGNLPAGGGMLGTLTVVDAHRGVFHDDSGYGLGDVPVEAVPKEQLPAGDCPRPGPLAAPG